jgi:hypothetical protein
MSTIKVGDVLVQNAQHFEPNTALCKVCTNDASYIVRLKSSSLTPFSFLVFHLHLLLSSLHVKLKGVVA